MKLFDYECPDHGVYEAWGSAGDSGQCPTCGGSTTQLIGSRGVLLDFKDPDFPRAWRMWADHHEREARKPVPKDADEYGF